MSKLTPCRRVILLLFAILAAFSAHPVRAADDPPQAVIAKNVMVPMRDGVRLATDVYFPAAEGKIEARAFPVVLIRTPYDKETKQADVAELARAQDRRAKLNSGEFSYYVFVAQDVRGRYQSEGDFYIYVNEGPDGYDCGE